MDENEIARRLLKLLQQNPNINLGEIIAREGGRSELGRITQFRHYRDDEVRQILKLLVPALVERSGLEVPGLIEQMDFVGPGPSLIEQLILLIPGLIEKEEIFSPAILGKQEIFVPSLIQKSALRLGDIGILFYTLHEKEGQHPEELCPCDRAWSATENGCVRSCSGQGEFQTQAECEAALDRRRSSNRQSSQKITSRFLSNSDNFEAIDGTQYPSAGGYYYFPAPVIIVAKNELQITSYTPNNSDDNLGVFGTSTGTTLAWSQVDVYEFGNAWIQYHGQTNNLVITFVSGDGGGLYNPSARKLWPSSANVIRGNINLASVPSPGYIGWREDGSLSGGGYRLDFRKFGHWVGQYITKSIPLPPFRNFDSPPPMSGGDPSTKHYTIKFWFGAAVENPILLGEYLYADYLTGNQIITNGFPDSAYQPSRFGVQSGSSLRANGVLPAAYMVAIGINEYEIVINYGKFTQADESTESVYGNKFFWCKKDVIKISNGRIASKIAYSYPETVTLHPKNAFSFWLQNWTIYNLVNGKNLGEFPIPSTYLGTFGAGSLFENSIDTATAPGFDVAIREYAKNHLFLTSNNSSRLLIPSVGEIYIQGKRIGRDAAHPSALAEMGITYLDSDDKKYVIDVGLNQFVPEAGDIFCDAVRTKSLKVKIKVGEFEYLPRQQWMSNFNANLYEYTYQVIKNPLAIADKTVFSLKNEYAGIIEACCWAEPANIEAAALPIYSNIYNAFFSSEQEVQENYFITTEYGYVNWAEKYPLANLSGLKEQLKPVYRHINTNRENLTFLLKRCDGSVVLDLTTISPFASIAYGAKPNENSALSAQLSIRPKIVGICP